MNELPVIGSCVMCKGLWDRQGQRLQVARRIYSEKLFRRPKNDFGGRSTLFHYLSEMDLDHVDTWKVE